MENPIKILIDKDLRPAYYDQFHCLAADCKMSCCVGWHISFNKKDYLSLKRQSGSPEFNARMEHGLRRIRRGALAQIHYGEFTMENNVCPLLREDWLCDLQVEKGPDALPEVCKTFPRSASYLSSGYLERSLSPACEGVLKLIWDLPDGVDFVSDPLPKEQHRNFNIQDGQGMLPFFANIREACIDMLQDRRRPLSQRILLMGMSLQELTHGGGVYSAIPEWLNHTLVLAEDKAVLAQLEAMGKSPSLPAFISNNLRTMMQLQNSHDDLTKVQQEIIAGIGVEVKEGTTLATISTIPYLEAEERFRALFGEQGERFMENLMVSLFFHLHLPDVSGTEALWKSYVNFCNLYSFYRFMAVMSCRKAVADGDAQSELFRLLVHASRALIHNRQRQGALRDEFFQNDSSTLAHMAILLGCA